MPQQLIKDTLFKLELEVARQKAVQLAFPNAKISTYGEFTDKSVNQSYTNLEFITRWQSLYVAPYCEVSFSFNEKEYATKIHSTPMKQRISYVSYDWRQKLNEIRFSRIAINMKTHKFSDKMLNSYHENLILFIQKFSNLPINDKHLDPKLKKMMSFL